MAMSAYILLIILAVQAAVAVEVEEEKRINGRGFCGLDDPNSRTYNLHLFIPLIKAEEEQLPDSTAAAGYSWICQRPFGNIYGNDPQFMTLYSRRNKLPVYSIYKADITWANDGKRATGTSKRRCI